ncbi:MAG: hypothetical protein ACREO8_02025, partial [Luteimonas sp.]
MQDSMLLQFNAQPIRQRLQSQPAGAAHSIGLAMLVPAVAFAQNLPDGPVAGPPGWSCSAKGGRVLCVRQPQSNLFILNSVQVETNNPRPCGEAAQS